MAEKMTLRGFVSEFCLFGDRVEALEAINKLIRAAAAQAHAEGRADALREAAEEADAAKLRLARSELTKQGKLCAVAAITAFAAKLRAMKDTAAGPSAGQPSGDAKAASPEEGT